MKKIFLSVLSIISFAICFGCQPKEVDEELRKVVNQEGDFQFGLSIANSEDGSYLVTQKDMEHTIVSFYDREADRVVPLCQKANCEHKDMDCSAFQLGTIENNEQVYKLFSLIFYKERLYLAYFGVGVNSHILVKSVQKDGSDIKTEYESSQLGILNMFSLYKDKVIISKGNFKEDEAGNIVGSSTINEILVYDPKTKEETVIANNEKLENCMVYPIGVNKETLYYVNINVETGKTKIISYHMKTKVTTSIKTMQKGVDVVYNHHVYDINENNEIIKRSIKTEKEKVITTIKETPFMFNVSPQGYLMYMDLTKEGHIRTQILDLNNNELLFNEMKNDIYVIGRNQDYYFIQDADNKLIRVNENGERVIK